MDIRWEDGSAGDTLKLTKKRLDPEMLLVVCKEEDASIVPLRVVWQWQLTRKLFKHLQETHKVEKFVLMPTMKHDMVDISVDLLDEPVTCEGGWKRVPLKDVEKYDHDEMAVKNDLVFMTDDYVEVWDYARDLSWIDCNGGRMSADPDTMVYIR